jgi:hypothetical protein
MVGLPEKNGKKQAYDEERVSIFVDKKPHLRGAGGRG